MVCGRILVSDHHNTLTHMNSQQLVLHAQDLHMIKPTKIPAWIGKALLSCYPCMRSYWPLIGSEIRKVSFIMVIVPQRLLTLPMNMHVAVKRLSFCCGWWYVYDCMENYLVKYSVVWSGNTVITPNTYRQPLTG